MLSRMELSVTVNEPFRAFEVDKESCRMIEGDDEVPGKC